MCGPGQPIASASASPSSKAWRARSCVRCACANTTHAPCGSSSAIVGIRSKTNGASVSAPSTNRPSAMRCRPSRKRSVCSCARRPASARISSSGMSSRTAGTSTLATFAVESWVDDANSRSDSTSSPQYSRRTGRRASPGNTSTTPPRTANSPRCSTRSARAYPRSTNRSASVSGARLRPATSSSGGMAPSVGIRPCIAARAGATTTNAPLAARRRWTASARRAEISGVGPMPSYGSASHAGRNATRSLPR